MESFCSLVKSVPYIKLNQTNKINVWIKVESTYVYEEIELEKLLSGLNKHLPVAVTEFAELAEG
jgi:hypothetical protein